MALEPIWRPRARIDLIDIYVAVARYNPLAAEKICGEIEAKVALLATYPRLGPRRRDIRPNARVLIERPYLVLYQLIPDTDEGPVDAIIIVRVVDARRDPTRTL